ncbi:MAG: recJ [Gammaproteobacteria bacterium]|jgi:single-stranded-DNA-specific exonuclease|nr:recJ [Gammaproteobacteria bacterium]
MDKVIVRHIAPTLQDHFSNETHPVLKKIYWHRDVTIPSEVDYHLNSLYPPDQLLNSGKAVACLIEALTRQKRVMIIGDFDADGATSTALMVSALRDLGFKHVDYLVPNRFEYGYGLTPEIVEVALKREPELIITVDNGISSIEGVAIAKAHGVGVIITDHHLPPDQLPDADAIVNPNQAGCLFPSKCLAGVGVAFYLILALRRYLRETGWFIQHQQQEPSLSPYLDLVALGTVADVVPLDRNNRILVYHGLRRIREGHARPGIMALLAVANRDHQRIVSADLGFALGPRLNAAGRLEDMSIGIQCLLAASLLEARHLASRLNALNEERKLIESKMQKDALAVLEAVSFLTSQETLPKGLCLTEPHWHQGVIGIVASRLKDRFHRPVIVFAEGEEGELKGSARSIAHVHIRDVLSDIATTHPDLILKFGGHAMAAGLTLRKKDFERFKMAFESYLANNVADDLLTNQLKSDGELSTECFSSQFALLLRDSGPWGKDFPEPLFDGKFYVSDLRAIGEAHLKLWLKPEADSQPVEAVLFHVDKLGWKPELQDYIHIAYRLDLNIFRGNQKVQLVIEHILKV